MKEIIKERFFRYVKMNTQSDENSKTFPSTPEQIEFQKLLATELEEIGLSEVELDENGYLMATIPSTIENDKAPVIGFISHVDTSPDFSGKNVKPQLFEKYKASKLDIGNNTSLSPLDFPKLLGYIGQDLITTDGRSLLGADDKAGVTEIVTAAEYLIKHPEIKHGKIRIAFTPDEEIGKGADKFDVKKFGADFAYTMDGGEIGELEYENFNAASARITINGVNVHPGTAKNKMKNSLLIAMELNSMLPTNEVPAYTEGYEGFYHLNSMEGDVSQTVLKYFIRDHDQEKFNQKKALIIKVVDHINLKYGNNTAKIIMMDQYYNMKQKIEPVMHIVDLAKEAMIEVGVRPIIKPIRGGTDGSRLSFMGLPTPNIFTGGHNYHGKYEFISLQSMVKAVDTIVKITELAAKE